MSRPRMKLDERTVLSVLAWHVQKIGYPPTIRELADELAVSTSTVAAALDRLELAGRITHTPGRARTIRILETGAIA